MLRLLNANYSGSAKTTLNSYRIHTYITKPAYMTCERLYRHSTINDANIGLLASIFRKKI